MANNEIRVNPEEIKKDVQELKKLENNVKGMLISWEPIESKGAMTKALQKQVKEINTVLQKMQLLIKKTREQAEKGRKEFVRTDKEQANKLKEVERR